MREMSHAQPAAAEEWRIRVGGVCAVLTKLEHHLVVLHPCEFAEAGSACTHRHELREASEIDALLLLLLLVVTLARGFFALLGRCLLGLPELEVELHDWRGCPIVVHSTSQMARLHHQCAGGNDQRQHI